MRELVSRPKPRTNFLKLSIQRRPMEWESGYRSAVRSSRDTMAVSGPRRIPGRVRRSRFPFLAIQEKRRTLRCSEELARLLNDSPALHSPPRHAAKLCVSLPHDGLLVS